MLRRPFCPMITSRGPTGRHLGSQPRGASPPHAVRLHTEGGPTRVQGCGSAAVQWRTRSSEGEHAVTSRVSQPVNLEPRTALHLCRGAFIPLALFSADSPDGSESG